jgi:hypothetical protein
LRIARYRNNQNQYDTIYIRKNFHGNATNYAIKIG